MNKELGTPLELDDAEVEEIFEGFEGVVGIEDGSDGEKQDYEENSKERWPPESELEAGAPNEMSNDTKEDTTANPHEMLGSETMESLHSNLQVSLDMPWMSQQQQSSEDGISIITTATTQQLSNLQQPALPSLGYPRSSFRGRLPWPAMEEIKELPEPLLPAVTLSEFSALEEERTREAQENNQTLLPEITMKSPTYSREVRGNRASTPVDVLNHTTRLDELEADNPLCTSRPGSSKSDADPLTTETATFRASKKGKYTPLAQSRLRNNLLASVGFLEFGNATDFAANVFNTIPVPVYAAVLMGLGGAVAIILSFFAVRDAVLSWRNVRILREERTKLIRRDKSLQAEEGEVEVGEVERTAEMDAMRLEVNRRELGSEIIDRFSMDALMGFGAFIVGVGTELAIGGANPRVYHASNLLSGYIGNSPGLLWGLCNTLWSIYVFRRARQHLKFGVAALESHVVKEGLRSRVRLVQMHSFMLGLATLVAGAGGMVTVTRWWGYVMLIPCIITNIWGNFLWRNRIGYERPVARLRERLWSRDEIVAELEWILEVKRRLNAEKNVKLTEILRGEMLEAETIIDFIVRTDLFEDFCWRLLKDKSFTTHMDEGSETPLIILTPQTILATTSQSSALILSTAQLSFSEKGCIQLEWKERYLFEMLGARLCVEHGTFQTPGIREARAQSRRASQATEDKRERGGSG
jgi:hypothetical protein